MGVIEASDRARKAVRMKGEKQGVPAWLRGIIDESYGNETCPTCTVIARMFFGIECEDVRSCGSCILMMFTAIADRIDAERALLEGMEWPRFEDGEPVKVGDEVEYKGETMRVYLATLDADGAPIKVGDTVYFVDGDARPLTVERIDANGGEPAVDLVYAGQILRWHSANPEKLTHERPDSWRLWGEDLDMAVKVCEVDKVEMMRRAKVLAKATAKEGE